MKRLLDKSFTLLIVPPADFPLWRAQVPFRSALGALVLWTSVTAWVSFRAARQVDYLATKADNGILRARVTSLVDEIERSGDDLAKAKDADQQLRKLLEMPTKQAIIEASPIETGEGGPTVWDRRDLLRRFAEDPAHESPAALEETLALLRQEEQARVASTAEIRRYVGKKHALFVATPLGWPASGHITSRFGYRLSPIEAEEGGFDEFHPGLDIAAKMGTEIHATADGVVERAGWAGGYGKLVFIRHSEGYATLFGHTSQLLVKVGDKVKRGQTIALMGSTGRSTGSHVHYEVWRRGHQIDPMAFLKSAR